MVQTNKNSLANLRKPKEKKEGYGYQYAIPREKIDELFAHMSSGLTLKKASQEVGICYESARKYYDQGDPKRGIMPIAKRLEIFNEKISKKMNVLLEENRMERLDFVRTMLKKAQESVLKPPKFYDDEGNEIRVYDEDGKEIKFFNYKNIGLRDIERLMKLEAFLCGGVTKEERTTTILSAEEISQTLDS